jgi:thiosulfate/3-mercaptopyruvate sulfurtransferase
MIKTFYGLGTLDSASAFFAALVIGIFFGLALERAGFGSSRRLAGIFYFRDMSVLKVMFTALLTAMLGLSICSALGWIDTANQIYFMKTYYGTYVTAGILFGIGFVMSGWCPGTAAVGLASGKADAAVFFLGALIGSIGFNELFSMVKPFYKWVKSTQQSFGEPGLAFVHNSLGLTQPAFAFLFTIVAVGCFWGSEALERKVAGKRVGGKYLSTPFLKALSIALIVTAGSLFLLPSPPARTAKPAADLAALMKPPTAASEKALLAAVASAEDHVEPEDLAEHLLKGDRGVIAVDVRPEAEFRTFHIRGALNIQLPDLPAFAAQHRSAQQIVLYSNGMTHPAQARDSLARLGFNNLFILTDGLTGFVERCLKPVSLRSEPLSEATVNKINAWRAYFYARDEAASPAAADLLLPPTALQGIVPTSWLAEHMSHPSVKVIDSRDQADYNRGHIPGSFAVSCESFRGLVGGLPSMLLPSKMLAEKLSLSGLVPTDIVVLVYSGDRVRDATLIGMVFERLDHQRYAIVEGGFDKWTAENRAFNTELPLAATSAYPVKGDKDPFTFTAEQVFAFWQQKQGVILDVRPADYYTGKKSDEARAGHIPGAVNRPFTEDLQRTDVFSTFKPAKELEAAYAKLIPGKETPVVVHCRTGHQASQTFFVLKNLLGYRRVYWYDAGWTEWSARKTLPIKEGPEP